MSGQLLIQGEKSLLQPHLRAKFGLSGKQQSNQAQIWFIDQRTFGWLSVEQRINGIPVSVRDIAYDPFESNFNLKKVVSNIKRRKSAIKPAILNQNIMSGVGNIYADEALWRAKIHPEIICEDLSEAEIRKVILSAISVMKSAIKAGGTSFDEQYKNVNGESGYFSRSLKVYGREGDPCPRCRSAIRRIAFANRSSHFCPRCQR
jgi:formamidopyrimidine-DNA glycosylase